MAKSLNYALRLFPALAIGLNNGFMPRPDPINFNLNKKSSPELDSANQKIEENRRKRLELKNLRRKNNKG
jgi:hypothetical protein